MVEKKDEGTIKKLAEVLDVPIEKAKKIWYKLPKRARETIEWSVALGLPFTTSVFAILLEHAPQEILPLVGTAMGGYWMASLTPLIKKLEEEVIKW